jgi:uncharacterized HhH-GPD family protein
MSNVNSSEQKAIIVQTMLQFVNPPDVTSRQTKAQHLDSWGLSREVAGLILEDPNAFLIGSLFDYLIPFRKAWEAPLVLKRRLGHLDVARIAAMDVSALQQHIKGDNTGGSLHRFPRILAHRLVSACNRLVANYDGSAARIWEHGSSAAVVVARLEEFEGISQKLSNMMVRILGTWCGVQLTDWNRIDIAVDRHVERVFQRTGLVPVGSEAIKPLIIQAARSLCPDFPGKLDDPTFRVGEKWCRSDSPLCDASVDGQICPLSKVCPRFRGSESVSGSSGSRTPVAPALERASSSDASVSGGPSSNLTSAPALELPNRGGQKVRWNPHTTYIYSRPGSATFAIYEHVKRQYPEWVDESTLVNVARAAGHAETTRNYVRNVVIPYAVDAKYKRFFMVRQ